MGALRALLRRETAARTWAAVFVCSKIKFTAEARRRGEKQKQGLPLINADDTDQERSGDPMIARDRVIGRRERMGTRQAVLEPKFVRVPSLSFKTRMESRIYELGKLCH
jgi:hypothetical protein